MSFLSVFRAARKARIADTPKPLKIQVGAPAGSRLVAAAAFIAAATLTFCAAWQSAGYAFALGAARSESTAYVFAAGAVAAAAMAPICLALCFSERVRFGRRLAGLFLGAWCLSFGVVGSLGYVSTAREASNAERAAAVEARAQAKTRHDAAAAELRSLSESKSTQWRAARAKELQAIMAESARVSVQGPNVTLVDPQSAALAHYLAAAGFTITPESVSTWTTAFTTAFYEVAGAFALVVARASGSASASSARPGTTCPGPRGNACSATPAKARGQAGR